MGDIAKEMGDSEVVFRLPQGVDAADFEDDLEISFNPKKRVHKRVLADVSNSSSPARSGQRKPATRHFFWDKGQAPMWSSSVAVVLDAGERDALCVGFAKAEARSPKRSKTAVSAATATGQNAAETGARKANAAESSTSVLSMERRRQIGIVFARLKIDAGELGAALERLSSDDVTVLLSGERLEMALELAPTVEEVQALVGYKGDAATLDSCDKSLATLAAVPKLLLRLRALQCVKTFDETTAAMAEGASALCAAAAELKSSELLATALHAVLAVGNFVNEGGKHGGASGFKLQSLGKLGHMKTKDGRSTMLHFVLRLLAERHAGEKSVEAPDGETVGSFADELGAELASLRAAARLSFSAMCIDRIALDVRVQKMQDEIAAAPDSPFAQAFADFATRARASLDEHSSMVESAGASLRQVLLHFGEIDAAVVGEAADVFQITPSQQTSVVSDAGAALFGTLLSFVEELVSAQRAHERSDREARDRAARRQLLAAKQPCHSSRLVQPAPVCPAAAKGAKLLPPSNSPVDQGPNKPGDIVSEMLQAANAKRQRYDSLHGSGSAVESPRTLTAKRAAAAHAQEAGPIAVADQAPGGAAAVTAQPDAAATTSEASRVDFEALRQALTQQQAAAGALEEQNAALKCNVQGLEQQLQDSDKQAAMTAAEMQETIAKQDERVQKLEKVKMTNGHLKAVAKLKQDNADLRKQLACAKKPSRLPGTPSAREAAKDAAEVKKLRAALETAKGKLQDAASLAEEQATHQAQIADELVERTDELSAARADIDAATKLEDLMRARCAKLEAKLMEIRSAGSAAEDSFTEAEVSFDTQLQEKDAEAAAIKQLLADHKSAAEAAQTALFAAEARARDLQTIADQQELAASAKEQARAGASRSQQEAERELSQLRAAMKRVEAEAQGARDMAAQSESGQREWQETAKAAEERSEALIARCEGAETQLTSAEEQICQCKARVEAADAEVKDLEDKLERATQEVDDAGGEATAIQDQLHAKLRAQQDANEELAAKHAVRTSELQADLEAASKLANEARETLGAQHVQETESSELKSELQHALESANSARQEIMVIEERCTILEAQNAELQEQVNQKQTQFDEFVTTSKQLEDGMESEIAELSRELESLTSSKAKLGADLELHKASAAALQSELDETVASLAESEQAKVAQDTAAHNLQGELETTRARLVDAEESLDLVRAQASQQIADEALEASPAPACPDDAVEADDDTALSTEDTTAPATDLELEPVNGAPGGGASEAVEESEKPAAEKPHKKRKKLRGKKSLCPGAFAEIKNMLELGEAEVVSLGKGKGFKCLGCGTKLPSQNAADAHKQSCTMTG